MFTVGIGHLIAGKGFDGRFVFEKPPFVVSDPQFFECTFEVRVSHNIPGKIDDAHRIKHDLVGNRRKLVCFYRGIVDEDDHLFSLGLEVFEFFAQFPEHFPIHRHARGIDGDAGDGFVVLSRRNCIQRAAECIGLVEEHKSLILHSPVEVHFDVPGIFQETR